MCVPKEFITLVNACFRAAIPFSLIPSGATAFELEHLFRTSEATRLCVHPKLLPNALDTAHKFGVTDDRIYILDGHIEGRTSLDAAIRRVRNRKVARVPCRPTNRDTLAYLVYSSGTSGLPKGESFGCQAFAMTLTYSLAVMVLHRNVIASMVQVAVATETEGPNPLLEVCSLDSCGPRDGGLPRASLNALIGCQYMRAPSMLCCRPSCMHLNVHSDLLVADRRLHPSYIPMTYQFSFCGRPIHRSRSLSCPCTILTAYILGASAISGLQSRRSSSLDGTPIMF